jgi:CDP-paratose 2-epimerase
MSRHFLITGGAGFIGSNAANHFLRRGDRVTLYDNFSRPGSEQNVHWLRQSHGDRLVVVRGDVARPNGDLQRVVAAADVVLHLAAQVAVTTSVRDPRLDFDTNALGTFNLLEAVRLSPNQPIVLYASTNKVYGKMADAAIVEEAGRYRYADLPGGASEERPLDFYSPYGCSKGTGDQYVLDYARIFGLRTVSFRQSCIYGPRQFGIEDQGWLAWFSICAMLEQGVTVYGDGKQVRDVLYIDDLLAAYDAAVARIDRASGQAYNIGGGPQYTLSLLELIDMLDKRFGRPLVHQFEDWRPGDQLVYISDVGKAGRDLGWTPRVAPGPGVERLLEWLSSNRSLFAAEAARESA